MNLLLSEILEDKYIEMLRGPSARMALVQTPGAKSNQVEKLCSKFKTFYFTRDEIYGAKNDPALHTDPVYLVWSRIDGWAENLA